MRQKRREAGVELTLELIDQIDRTLLNLGWTRDTLAARSGVAERTIQGWLGSEGRDRAAKSPIRPRLLRHVLEALGIQLGPQTGHESDSVSADNSGPFVRVGRSVSSPAAELQDTFQTTDLRKEELIEATRRILTDKSSEVLLLLKGNAILQEQRILVENVTLATPKVARIQGWVIRGDHKHALDYTVEFYLSVLGRSALDVADRLAWWIDVFVRSVDEAG